MFLSYFLQVVLHPTTNGPKTAELHKMVVPKNSQDVDLKIKLAVRMDKPPNMKHSGYVCNDAPILTSRIWMYPHVLLYKQWEEKKKHEWKLESRISMDK